MLITSAFGRAHRKCPSWMNSPSACLWLVSCRDLVLVWENIMGLLEKGMVTLTLAWPGLLTVACACPLLAILCWTCSEKDHHMKPCGQTQWTSTFTEPSGKPQRCERKRAQTAQREKRRAARWRPTLGRFNLSLGDDQINCLLLRPEHWFRRRVVSCWWLKVI